MENKEIRTYTTTLEIRDGSENNSGTVEGYAAVFNSQSEKMWGFTERIDPGAFDGADLTDVRALFNHDANHLLARSSSNTLALKVDDKGLKYKFDMPDTTIGQDLKIMMKRGDINQSSFAFTVKKDEWHETRDDDGNIEKVERVIKKIDRLFDVSIVTYPAYTDAKVALRSLKQYRADQATDPQTVSTPNRDKLEKILKLQGLPGRS